MLCSWTVFRRKWDDRTASTVVYLGEGVAGGGVNLCSCKFINSSEIHPGLISITLLSLVSFVSFVFSLVCPLSAVTQQELTAQFMYMKLGYVECTLLVPQARLRYGASVLCGVRNLSCASFLSCLLSWLGLAHVLA